MTETEFDPVRPSGTSFAATPETRPPHAENGHGGHDGLAACPLCDAGRGVDHGPIDDAR